MRHHGQHRDPVPRPSEARRPDLHRGTAGDRERREARRGTSEGRAEGRQVRGDLLEVLPAAGPRPGRRQGQAREQRNALRQEGQWDGPRPPHGGLSGPDAGRSVRAERFHLEGAEETRCAARLHPRRLRHGPDGDEAAGLGAATGLELVKEMEKYGVVFSRGEPGAGIVGASGLLLGLGRLYDMNAVCLMGETSGYFVDPKSAQAVLDVLTKYLSIEISFNELENKAKQIDQITSKLKDIEAAPETPDKREDLGYIG